MFSLMIATLAVGGSPDDAQVAVAVALAKGRAETPPSADLPKAGSWVAPKVKEEVKPILDYRAAFEAVQSGREITLVVGGAGEPGEGDYTATEKEAKYPAGVYRCRLKDGTPWIEPKVVGGSQSCTTCVTCTSGTCQGTTCTGGNCGQTVPAASYFRMGYTTPTCVGGNCATPTVVPVYSR